MIEIYPHIYGELHTANINSNIQKARDQLAKTARRQSDTTIARVVVLAFKGSSGGRIGLDWRLATKAVIELLPYYPDISAIAIMNSAHKYKYEGEDIIEWPPIELVPHFAVFHSRWLDKNIKQLDTSAFLDDYSAQASPL